jgi:hypothetical protein
VLQRRDGHHQKSIARVQETPWLPDAHVTVVDGIPCTTAPSSWPGYRVLEVTYHQLVQEPEKVARRLRDARRNVS